MVKPKSKFVASQDTEFAKYAIDDCARACNEHLGYECKSFDFCYITGDCRISPRLTDEKDIEYMSDDNCDVYESKFLSSLRS